MSAKQKKISSEATNENPKALRVERQHEETNADALAHVSLRPTVQAALTLMDINKAFGEMSVNALVADLLQQCQQASNGDLNRAEAILIAQAHTLDALFHQLARRAQRAEYLNQLDTNLRLALKAQTQCRATLETLAEIKNPKPVAFVRQANITSGPQQVNNNSATSRAENSENLQDKVLEQDHGERLDTGAARATIGSDTKLETVGAVHRPEDKGR